MTAEDATGDGWLRKLADLEVVVVAEPSEDLKFLSRELHALKMRVRQIWPAPNLMPQAADLLICDYSADLAQRFAWLPGTPPAALLILLPRGGEIAIDPLVAAVPDAVLALPATPSAIRANLMLAINQFRFGQRMRAKVERLEDNIRSLRLVERAKAIMMAKKHIGDADAYQAIRQLAMTKRVPVATIAAAIVDSTELLGQDEL
ncbi:ANTAR domain-containing response regulator [Labrys neptuniae]